MVIVIGLWAKVFVGQRRKPRGVRAPVASDGATNAEEEAVDFHGQACTKQNTTQIIT